jgi:hypothetical protein
MINLTNILLSYLLNAETVLFILVRDSNLVFFFFPLKLSVRNAGCGVGLASVHAEAE